MRFSFTPKTSSNFEMFITSGKIANYAWISWMKIWTRTGWIGVTIGVFQHVSKYICTVRGTFPLIIRSFETLAPYSTLEISLYVYSKGVVLPKQMCWSKMRMGVRKNPWFLRGIFPFIRSVFNVIFIRPIRFSFLYKYASNYEK